MARKGSHPSNGTVRNGTKAKTKFPEVLNPLPSDSTGKPVADGQKIFEDKGLDASDCERFFGSLNSNTEEMNSSESVKKTCRVGNASHREGSKSRYTCEQSDTFSNNLNGVKLTFTLDDSRGDSVISDRDIHISEISDNMQNAEVEHDPMARRRFSVELAFKHLLILIWHLLQIVITWVERQRPLVNTFTMVIFDARDYVQIKIKHAYPFLRSWVSHFVKILFLLSMAWLDCSLRGLGSLLHLGTTCFFTIFWCSLLSLLAMIGITKMLLTLVMAGLVVLFAGVGIAFLMVATTSAVVLWFYGNFWTTVLVIILGGAAFGLSHERIALFLTTVYSLHCTGYYMGWLGLFMALNLSFISSDVLINFLRSSIRNQESEVRPEQTTASNNRANNIHEESKRAVPPDDSSNLFERSTDHDAGVPSTSGASAELTSENEVVRLLTCTDHYSALGFARYESIDVSSLKREYKKKAMLVHPDKNMGNEKAAEAFKKLQNAYEVLLDSLKRKTYDDELRREEILNYFRRFQHNSRKNGRDGVYGPGFSQDSGNDHSTAEARRIACKKCGDLHIWIHMNRPKSRARWCQDCKDFHHAKDGDGWVEQSSQPLMFGLLNKLDPPRAYVCADSIIYDATEWFNCQGMRCPVNNHKPTFHINTAVTSSKHNAKGTHSSGGGTAGAFPGVNMDETMTEEELMEWLQNAMQSGVFYAPGSAADEGTPTKTSSFPKNVSKKKRKGKKPW